MLWSIDRTATAQSLVVLASLMLLFLLAATLQPTRQQLRELEVAVVVGGTATAVFGLWLLFTGSLIATDEAVPRFATAGGGGGVSDPNITAASLLLPLVLGLTAVFRSTAPRIRVAATIAAAVTASGIALTGSRGGVAAALVGSLIVVSIERRPRGLLPWLAGFAVVAAVILIVTASGVDERLTRSGTTGRSDIWKVGIKTCSSYCASGSGFGSFSAAYQRELLRSSDLTGYGLRSFKAHNIWLAMLVESGIPGLLLGFWGLWLIMTELARLPKRVRGPPTAAMVALLTSNLFLNNLSFKYFWMVLIYAVLTTRGVEDGRARGGVPPRTPAPMAASRF